jgi:hypothetical protein
MRRRRHRSNQGSRACLPPHHRPHGCRTRTDRVACGRALQPGGHRHGAIRRTARASWHGEFVGAVSAREKVERARAIEHHHLLSELLGEPARNDARQHVGRASGRRRRYQGDRTGRIVLPVCNSMQPRTTAKRQMETDAIFPEPDLQHVIVSRLCIGHLHALQRDAKSVLVFFRWRTLEPAPQVSRCMDQPNAVGSSGGIATGGSCRLAFNPGQRAVAAGVPLA